MTDFQGNKLKVGDKVIFMASYAPRLFEGTIESFTPTMARIKTNMRGWIINRKSEQIYKV